MPASTFAQRAPIEEAVEPRVAPRQDDPSEAIEPEPPVRIVAKAPEKTADKEALQRALRDLEETEARVKRNAERVYDESRQKLVVDLLPVLDNLDRTVEAAETSSDPVLVQGLGMVRSQLESVLIRYGVERIEATGLPFDPKEHDAIAMIEVTDPAQRNTVVRQSAPGYRFNGRVLRAAKVQVGSFTPPKQSGLEIDDSFFGPTSNRFS